MDFLQTFEIKIKIFKQLIPQVVPVKLNIIFCTTARVRVLSVCANGGATLVTYWHSDCCSYSTLSNFSDYCGNGNCAHRIEHTRSTESSSRAVSCGLIEPSGRAASMDPLCEGIRKRV